MLSEVEASSCSEFGRGAKEKELAEAARVQTVIVYCVLGLAWRYAFKNYLLESRRVPETLDGIKDLDAS